MIVSKIVEDTLREKPYTRNSDKELLLHVWSHLGLELTAEQRSKFRDMPSTETVRRIRQKLQEGGKYPADQAVRKVRQFESQQMQQIAPIATPKYISQTLEQGALL